MPESRDVFAYRPRIRSGGPAGALWYEDAQGRVKVIDTTGLEAGDYALRWDGTDYVLVTVAAIVPEVGRWEPLVDNSDPDNPELVFLGESGDLLMVWIED